jgi:lipopolysaccharide transport system permease protein
MPGVNDRPLATGRAPASTVARTHIAPSRGWRALRLREIWDRRELLYLLVWRDLKVRYTQTFLGAAWAVIQPVVSMVIFSVIFGRLAGMPSDDLPYPIFTFTALLPWYYFSSSLGRVAGSVVAEAHLISKIYFPRLIIPLSGVTSGIVDFAVSFCILLGMMAWFGLVPTWRILALPFFLLLVAATALGIGLWLSALNVRYRDVGHLMPFVIQCWFYASPVIYPVTMIPEQWRLVYSLNPMVGVLEGFRWALLGKTAPRLDIMIASAFAVTAALVLGAFYFKRVERTFVDLA